MIVILFILGALTGCIFAITGQYNLEKGYTETGIAKILGKYYKITPYEKEN